MESSIAWHAPSEADTQKYSPQSVFDAGIRHHHIANTAYPIAHTKTMKDYRERGVLEIRDRVVDSWRNIEEMGLYVHIPFCERRCAFCEYTVVDPQSAIEWEDRYFDLLEREFELYAKLISTRTKRVVGFDIGGGTPSFAKVENIERVISLARKHFDLSDTLIISIETTPKIAAADPEKIQAFYDMGIRRISMGVQAVSPKVLDLVGRSNTTIEWNKEAVKHIRDAGFSRFNVDIMYGMYGQNRENIRATVDHVLSLDPEYVTLYRTRYKGTTLSDHAEHVTLEAANEQWEFLKERLLESGYEWRDGKNTFSRISGDEGTSDYLTRRVINGTPYLWLGLGAQTYNLEYLAYNLWAAEKSMKRYAAALEEDRLPIQDLYHLSLPVSIAKFVSVSFYFGGVDYASFEKNFSVTFDRYFRDQVTFCIENAYMERRSWGLYLTKKGVENYNGVIALFYASAVQRHLVEK